MLDKVKDLQTRLTLQYSKIEFIEEKEISKNLTLNCP